MKSLLVLVVINTLINLFATYTYTVQMNNAMQAVYTITNILGALSWGVLGWLTYLCRKRYSKRSLVFSWIRPVTLSFKIFCAVSFLRCALNDLVMVIPILEPLQALVYIANNVCLAVACGYASVYFRKIPHFIDRAVRHQANSRRFDVFIEKAVDAMIEIDEDSNIWFANDAAARIFGFVDRKEMLGLPITDFMPKEFRARHLDGMKRYLETGVMGGIIGNPRPTRLHALRRDGTEFAMELTLTEYKIVDTRRFCAVIRDLSYQAALEKAVIEKAE